MDASALGAYGYRFPTMPGGGSVQAETQGGDPNNFAGEVMGKLPLGINNPLFWLLVIFLVFTGWMYFGASLGIKRIGSLNVKVGK